MTTAIVVGLGRPTSVFVVVVLLCCSNGLRMVTDAFQTRTTEFFRPVGFPTQRQNSDLVPSSFDGERYQHCRQSRKEGRLFTTKAPAMSPTNATSINDVTVSGIESKESPIPSEVFFPPVDLEGEKSMSEASTTAKQKGRKRRAMKKLRENCLSRPINHRLVRTLLFPMRVLIWKPLWMIMDILIDSLEDDETTKVNLLESSDVNERIAVSSTPQAAKDAVSFNSISEEEGSMPESNPISSVESFSDVESPTESMKLKSSSTAEEPPDTIEEEKDIIPVDTEDSTVDTADNDAPKGDRWANAAPGVDLSGKWELIVTDDFKEKYDKYLEGLGQPKIVRSVALSGPVIGKTMEELIQIDGGRSLLIRGKNIRGTWDRTLVASGSTKTCSDFEPLISPIKTVDQELVEAEAWWEDEGKSHVSWMRGVTMYGGGNFYSRRYFEDKENEGDETVYVCEGFFEFNDPNKANNELTWRFRRMKD